MRALSFICLFLAHQAVCQQCPASDAPCPGNCGKAGYEYPTKDEYDAVMKDIVPQKLRRAGSRQSFAARDDGILPSNDPMWRKLQDGRCKIAVATWGVTPGIVEGTELASRQRRKQSGVYSKRTDGNAASSDAQERVVVAGLVQRAFATALQPQRLRQAFEIEAGQAGGETVDQETAERAAAAMREWIFTQKVELGLQIGICGAVLIILGIVVTIVIYAGNGGGEGRPVFQAPAPAPEGVPSIRKLLLSKQDSKNFNIAPQQDDGSPIPAPGQACPEGDSQFHDRSAAPLDRDTELGSRDYPYANYCDLSTEESGIISDSVNRNIGLSRLFADPRARAFEWIIFQPGGTTKTDVYQSGNFRQFLWMGNPNEHKEDASRCDKPVFQFPPARSGLVDQADVPDTNNELKDQFCFGPQAPANAIGDNWELNGDALIKSMNGQCTHGFQKSLPAGRDIVDHQGGGKGWDAKFVNTCDIAIPCNDLFGWPNWPDGTLHNTIKTCKARNNDKYYGSSAAHVVKDPLHPNGYPCGYFVVSPRTS